MHPFMIRYLERLSPVPFTLLFDGECTLIGKGKPRFTVTLHRAPSKRELLSSTSLALAEAYIRKDLELDRDLYEVLVLFLKRMDRFQISHALLHRLLSAPTSRRVQQENVMSHYDIGNDFYRLFLDKTMSYSCGYFRHKTDSLYKAQIQKVDHILEKLQLSPGMTLLDIGCGWGFLLKRAAEKYQVRGLGITLSRKQHRQFSEEIRQQGLGDVLEVRLMDYRDLSESGLSFDRVVSVGMLEHVGRSNYGLFLQNVHSVLRPGGLFLLHYISALEEHAGDPFIRKYIFPGGVIPSLREIISLLPEHQFYTLDVESLRRHYTRTLLSWRKNFLSHQAKIEEQKGEAFARMWELYLASCAAAFHNGVVDLHQLLLSKGVNNSLPMTRIV